MCWNDDCVDSPEAVTVRRLRRVMAVFTWLLVGSTWPLWTPGTDFPDIPWFAWAVHWPPEKWDWLWLASLGGFTISQLIPQRIQGRRLKTLRIVLFAGAVMLLPTDQHRLQPWVWQMLLATVLIAASATDRAALRSLRLLTISIYFWSAASKFDRAFVEGLGQVLLDGLAESVGLSTNLWTPTLRHALAASFPVGELVVAVLLMVARTRWFGMWAAIIMHGMLMLTVGPLGLGHEWSVFLWNGFFGVQGWLLFRQRLPDLRDSRARESIHPARRTVWMEWGLTGVVSLLPALSLIGWWDWWPSWAVYSSRPVEVRAYIDATHSAAPATSTNLPKSLHRFVDSESFGAARSPVLIDQWSYETCWCPVYPQARYRLALIAAVDEQSERGPLVLIRSTPDRWTGERRELVLETGPLSERLATYWFNTAPRSP